MLTITVLGEEMFDDNTQQFKTYGDVDLTLEHNLVSLSKWESIHEKPFLSETARTPGELISYVKCMCNTINVPQKVYDSLSEQNIQDVNTYINAKMTGTQFFGQASAPRTRETITAELIYYWMTVFSIPFECQYWHLNRLFTLIQVCNLKQAKPKKMSRSEIAQRNRDLNAQRKAKLGTKG